jgi:hypothetical protein
MVQSIDGWVESAGQLNKGAMGLLVGRCPAAFFVGDDLIWRRLSMPSRVKATTP